MAQSCDRTCPSCGTRGSVAAKFCAGCGARTDEVANLRDEQPGGTLRPPVEREHLSHRPVSDRLLPPEAGKIPSPGDKQAAPVESDNYAAPSSAVTENLANYRGSLREGRCWRCGYVGALGIDALSRRVWWASYWMIIPLILTGVGLFAVVVIALLANQRQFHIVSCPACSTQQRLYGVGTVLGGSSTSGVPI